MKRIALIRAGVVASVALWDGTSPWDPVAAGQCDSTVDVTARPNVGPGYTYAGGVFAAPAEVVTPDPGGFIRAVVTDATIAVATKNAIGPWLYSLAAALQAGDATLIAGEWANLVAGLPVSAADRATIVGYASTHHVPGIA